LPVSACTSSIRSPLLRGASLLVLLALLDGCGTATVSLREGPRSFTEADYEDVYAAWSRDDDDFDWGQLRSVLHVTATYESWEFRWGYVVRYAADHSLDTDARTALLRASLDDARENHRFFVTLAGEDWRQANLTSARSAWRVLLVDDRGNQIAPAGLERLRRPSAAESAYFPTVSPQRQAFRITFPARRPDGSPTIPLDSRHLILRFTGALGRVDLRWELDPVPDPGEGPR